MLIQSNLAYRYQLEHGLTPEGYFDESRADEVGSSGSYDTFYTETSGGKYVPRAIFADLDPSVWGNGIHLQEQAGQGLTVDCDEK
jgi:hypothetical protein